MPTSTLPRVAILAIALLVAAACAPSDAPADDTPAFAFVSNGIDPYWVIAQAGVEQAGADLGVDVSVHMPAQGITDQKRILEDLLVRGVAGVAVSPIDPANQVELLDELAGRMALVTTDSDAPDSQRACFIGVDNYVAGRMAGELVREALPDGGEVAVFVGRLEQDNARRRRQGLIDELLGRDADPERFDPADGVIEGNGYRVVGTFTDQFDMAKGKANVEDAMSRHPELACAVGLFAYNAPLILEAVSQAGRVGELAIVGFDERDETLGGVRDGAIHATVVQDPYTYGYRSIERLEQLHRGDRSQLPADGFERIPARAIRRDEVEAFWAEMKARLGT